MLGIAGASDIELCNSVSILVVTVRVPDLHEESENMQGGLTFQGGRVLSK